MNMKKISPFIINPELKSSREPAQKLKLETPCSLRLICVVTDLNSVLPCTSCRLSAFASSLFLHFFQESFTVWGLFLEDLSIPRKSSCATLFFFPFVMRCSPSLYTLALLAVLRYIASTSCTYLFRPSDLSYTHDQHRDSVPLPWSCPSDMSVHF